MLQTNRNPPARIGRAAWHLVLEMPVRIAREDKEGTVRGVEILKP
jgi:hypothetical protein